MTKLKVGYFNYGPTFTEVFSPSGPSGGKKKISYVQAYEHLLLAPN
jgi:hypothetical protein